MKAKRSQLMQLSSNGKVVTCTTVGGTGIYVPSASAPSGHTKSAPGKRGKQKKKGMRMAVHRHDEISSLTSCSATGNIVGHHYFLWLCLFTFNLKEKSNELNE